MISRGTVIAALLAVEVAICAEAVVAVSGGRADAHFAAGPRLIEGGPHHVFDAGASPALTVDIGYADLTIVTGTPGQFDVSAAPSAAFGMLQAKEPIAASEVGGTVHISKSGERGLSIGDDRMVTVVAPPGTAVTVIAAGDIKAAGLRASASFHSVGRGSITIENFEAPALTASSNGRIVLRRVDASHLEATSKEDRVEGIALRVRDGSVESSDRVTLGFAPGADSLVTADADDGEVVVSGFPTAPETNGRKSGTGGDDDSSTRTVRVGSGAGRLDVHSSDGNIHLTQEGSGD